MTSPEFSIDVPSQCANCPVVSMLREEYQAIEDSQSTVFGALTSDVLPDRIKKQLRKADPAVTEEFLQAQVPNAMSQFREQASPLFEEFAERKAELQDAANDYTEGCPGRSSMRAKDKLGRMVTIRLCSSPKKQPNDDSFPEPVYIERQA